MTPPRASKNHGHTIAVWNGPGLLTDHASGVEDLAPGDTFRTTAKRIDELKAHGIHVDLAPEDATKEPTA